MVITNIQALRAFAALNVVLFHIIGTSKAHGFEPKWISILEGWSANGVDIFFVISGFIMVYVQQIKQKDAISFAVGRVTRIAPVYWALTSIPILSALFLTTSSNISLAFLTKMITSLLFISRLTGHDGPTIYVGWTLEYEMLFYLIFAVSLLLKKPILQFSSVTIAVLAIATFAPINPIIIEFVFGMMVAQLFLHQKGAKLGNTLFIAGCTALLISIFWETSINRVIIWGIPAALIVYSVCNMPQTGNKLLLHVGNASYSTYLVQVFTIPVFYKFCSLSATSLPSDVLALLCLVYTAIIGSVVYIFLERPLHLVTRKYKSCPSGKLN